MNNNKLNIVDCDSFYLPMNNFSLISNYQQMKSTVFETFFIHFATKYSIFSLIQTMHMHSYLNHILIFQ